MKSVINNETVYFAGGHYEFNDTTGEVSKYYFAGNLDVKNGLDLEYDDVNHVHAVTSAGVNTYSYDDNGNQTTRNVGGQTVQLDYDAENRLVSVTGTNLSAQFYYNGDGQRVKSVINNETVYFAGGHFEFNNTTDEVTKHYFAGASRIAVRKYIVPQSTTLNYLLGDHLGSTSVVTNEAGALVVETRYKPWGEVRFTTENLTLPTRYTFTGQYSYMNDDATDLGAAGFGLMFYNARWYDPALGRFAQADSIMPGGVQGLDRYAYVNNSPVRYTDPSGHMCSDPEDPTPECDGANNVGERSYTGDNDNFHWDSQYDPGLTAEEREKAEQAYLHFLEDPQYFYNLYFNSDLSAWLSEEVQYLDIYLQYSTIHMSADEYLLGMYGMDVTTGAMLRALNADDPQAAHDFAAGLGLAGFALAGRGQSSTGRHYPLTPQEQALWDRVMSDPLSGRNIGNLGDPRWPVEEGWMKMEMRNGSLKVHYVLNVNLGEVDDIKIP